MVGEAREAMGLVAEMRELSDVYLRILDGNADAREAHINDDHPFIVLTETKPSIGELSSEGSDHLALQSLVRGCGQFLRDYGACAQDCVIHPPVPLFRGQ